MTELVEALDMSLSDAILSRRSVRGYLDKEVPTETLEAIFKLAQYAPSNCNIQPWKSFVASGETRDRIRSRMMDDVMNSVPFAPDYDYPGRFEGEYRIRPFGMVLIRMIWLNV